MATVTAELRYHNGRKVYHIGDGHYYHVNRRSKNRISLRCIYYYTKHCCGRATCNISLDGFVQTKPHFGHTRNKSLPSVWRLRRKIMDRCRTTDATKPAQIVQQESAGFSRSARAGNTAVRLRSSMRRARLHLFPNVPNDLSELHDTLTSERWRHLTKLKSGHGYMYAGRCGSSRSRSRCLIFMSPRMKNILKRTKIVFCDSTWDGRPGKPKSSQMFSMTTTWDHQIIPLVIVLMESKKKQTYLRLFESLLEIVPEFDPEIFHCDNEIGQYMAILERFPRARVAACLYHYASRVSEKARKLELTGPIAGSKVLRSITRSCLAIPLVPQDDLQLALESIMARADNVLLYDILQPLFKYLWDEWITKRENVLSVHGCDDRTSNVSESFNHTLQVYTVERRPNIFMFIDALLRLEDTSKQNVYCMIRGISTGRSRKVSAVNNDKAVKNLTKLLSEGAVSMAMFLRRASYRINAPFCKVFPEAEDSSDDDTDDDD